jgi:endo-1,4-beta-xylanase
MKWGEVERQRGEFDGSAADEFVTFGKAHGLKIRGHTLVWHSQLPRWLITGSFSPDDVKALMLAHITLEAARYKGSIYAWDVVNEPLTDDGGWRPSIFYDAMGPQYISLALKAAREADASAKLYINEYGAETAGAKQEALYRLVASLKAEGVPLDGVGFQCHFMAGAAPNDLLETMRRFASLGVDVAVTELDLRIRLPATDEDYQAQARDYADVVSACRITPRCVGVTTWGLSDDRSWIPGYFSGYGSALPFDENYRPKPAVGAIVKAFAGPAP